MKKKSKKAFMTCADKFKTTPTRQELVVAYNRACTDRLKWKREKQVLLDEIAAHARTIAELKITTAELEYEAPF